MMVVVVMMMMMMAVVMMNKAPLRTSLTDSDNGVTSIGCGPG